MLAANHQNDAFEGEALGLGFDRGSDGVGFEEGGVHDDKVVVWWVVNERIHDDANGWWRQDGQRRLNGGTKEGRINIRLVFLGI